MKMSDKEFVEEHKKLIRVLKSGNRKDLKREAKEQEEELKEYLLRRNFG